MGRASRGTRQKRTPVGPWGHAPRPVPPSPKASRAGFAPGSRRQGGSRAGPPRRPGTAQHRLCPHGFTPFSGTASRTLRKPRTSPPDSALWLAGSTAAPGCDENPAGVPDPPRHPCLLVSWETREQGGLSGAREKACRHPPIEARDTRGVPLAKMRSHSRLAVMSLGGGQRGQPPVDQGSGTLWPPSLTYGRVRTRARGFVAR